MGKKKCKNKNTKLGDFEGCGELKYIHAYGLCSSCFAKWLYTTAEGKEYLKKKLPQAKKKHEKDKKKELKEKKESLKTLPQCKKDLQTVINTIVRMIDVRENCISCNYNFMTVNPRQAHAGHYFSVGSNDTIRFNVHNIHKQCSICNNPKSGNIHNYRIGLDKRYGVGYFENEVQKLKQIKSINLTKADIKEKIIIARKILKKLKSGKNMTRNEINKELGIY